MVRRFVTVLLSLVIVLLGVLPFCFAYDVVQTDADNFGFGWDDHAIIFTQNRIAGNQISVTTSAVPISRVYFYVPVPKPMVSMDFIFTLCKSTGNLSYNSCDYGTIYGNAYHYTASLDSPTTSWLGSSSIEGSNARNISYKVSFLSLPFTDSNSYRFIRITFDFDSGTSMYTYLSRYVSYSSNGIVSSDTDNQLLLGGTQSISNSGATISANITMPEQNVYLNSGAINYAGGGFITGLFRSYYDASQYSLVQFTASSTGTNRLVLPGMRFTLSDADRLSGKIQSKYASNAISGSISNDGSGGTWSTSWSSGSLISSDSGSFVDREYIDTVVMSAVRSYSDQDLIQAVNNASDRNHTDITNFSNRNHSDLTNIGNQLQELVDHQDAVTATGNDIGSTTSTSTITNTSGNLSSGVNGLNSTLSTASDVSSFVSSSQPYIGFIGAGLPLVLNFGNGVLAWAVVAIVAVTVIMYILRKVSE